MAEAESVALEVVAVAQRAMEAVAFAVAKVASLVVWAHAAVVEEDSLVMAAVAVVASWEATRRTWKAKSKVEAVQAGAPQVMHALRQLQRHLPKACIEQGGSQLM